MTSNITLNNIYEELKNIKQEVHTIKEQLDSTLSYELEEYLSSEQFQKDKKEMDILLNKIESGEEKLLTSQEMWEE